ncbi:MAG: hypothetical protein K1X79_13085 [Oligoflexia bacterium]|nr:hypothetical protein [Oligoflexia bacterium]
MWRKVLLVLAIALGYPLLGCESSTNEQRASFNARELASTTQSQTRTPLPQSNSAIHSIQQQDSKPARPNGLQRLRLGTSISQGQVAREIIILSTYRGDVNGDGLVDWLDLEDYSKGSVRCPGALASFESTQELSQHIRSMNAATNAESYADLGGLAGCSLNDQDLLRYHDSPPNGHS